MTDETRKEVLRHGVRWASNILVELQGNHARHLSEAQKRALREATQALAAFQACSGD